MKSVKWCGFFACQGNQFDAALSEEFVDAIRAKERPQQDEAEFISATNNIGHGIEG